MVNGTRFLAALQYPGDFQLGPEKATESSLISARQYRKTESDEEFQFMIVGVVLAVIKRENGEKVLVLQAPPSTCPLLWNIFVRQTKALGDIMLSESWDTSKLILNKEGWNQGPKEHHAGIVYVHMSDNSRMAIINTANNFVGEALREVAPEVSSFGDKSNALETGSLLVNIVSAHRIDGSTEYSATTKLWNRTYKLEASHIIQLYKCDS
ncbi:hypothetical protein C8F04DRAFT_1133601 [Mycena alexandri]|uniref:Uncharacterized protein n=1 Tax=Mycena alexandri TaxID=1745969 RepID=A0AAD6SA47_9AGAR|nr:hypothetical protein C8F04DRAFT_1133601 [Mycena alexandri]